MVRINQYNVYLKIFPFIFPISVILTLLLLSLASVFAPALSYNNKWRQEPYGNDDFNVKAPYLSNTTLTCNDTGVERGPERVPAGLTVSLLSKGTITGGDRG